MEDVYKNSDDMPISDILTEIRQLVSNETNKRYSRDKERAVSELLVLRPEARVDLALKEAIEPKKTAKTNEPKVNTTNLLDISSREELRDFIRQVFHEEFESWSES